MLPNVSGVIGDVVTINAYYDTEGRFLQSVALLTTGHNLCLSREMTVSGNNGLMHGLVHNLLLQFFTL